jgi:capsule polysaccharide modification protein KpsS
MVGKKKASRNAPCYCGSGLKFKKCCEDLKGKAERKVRDWQRSIDKRLLAIMREKGIRKAKITSKSENEGFTANYYIDGEKVLVFDYTGLPLSVDTRLKQKVIMQADFSKIPVEEVWKK